MGFQKRLGDVRAAERFERELWAEAHAASEAERLRVALRPMKPFPEVERFSSFFDGGARFRRPILVIVGGTNLGKSLLAGAVLRAVAEMLGLNGFLEVTVEDSDTLDLADFDGRVHAGVLLDGVNNPLLLKNNREVLQGRPKLSEGARSAPMTYA